MYNHSPDRGLFLDAGCGILSYTKFLKEKSRDNDIIPIDISNFCDGEASRNDFALSSVENLPFKDNTFDFVFCLSVLELTDDARTFNELYRVLKPGKKLVFSVPSRYSIFRMLRELEIGLGVYQYATTEVCHYYSRGDIEKLCNHIPIEEIYGYNYNFISRLVILCKNLLKKNILKIKVEKESMLKIKTNSNYDKIWENIGHYHPNKILRKVKLLNELAYHQIVIIKKDQVKTNK